MTRRPDLPEAVRASRPLAALCAALSFVGDAGRAAPRIGGGDEAEFLRLAIERHRIAPLLAQRSAALDLPATVRQAIGDEAGRNTIRLTVLMHALGGVLERLASIGVVPVILKGPPLAESVYGAAELRDAGDLDLLVPPDAIADSVAALRELGYRIDPRHVRREQVLGSRALRDECNDLALLHPGTGVAVELHWRPHHFSAWPDLFSDASEIVVTPSSVGDLLVPSDRANMIYLSLHGGTHLWGRLKWVADIAWLARRRGPEQLAEDLDFARRTGSRVAVAVALRAADRLIGCPLPYSLADERPLPLEKAVLSTITDDAVDEEGLRFRLNSYFAALHLSQGSRRKLSVLRYGVWRPLRLLASGAGRG